MIGVPARRGRGCKEGLDQRHDGRRWRHLLYTWYIPLPPMEKIIGYPDEANVIAGGWDGSLASDGSITVELQAIIGATSELGFTKLGAYTI